MAKNELMTIDQIKTLVSSPAYKNQFSMALPKHLKADRFIRIALTAFNKTPKLANCTVSSLFSCLLDLSQLGLEPDGRKAHLIPYGDQCTLIVDYKGLVELARRSGEISDIHADVVYEKDFFEYSFGTEGKLIHKPAIEKRGEPIAAYSFVLLKDGSSSYEVMNKEDIEAIRKRSKAKDVGPWKTDWNEMAKKTVFRRHSKWLPISNERFQLINEKDFDIPTNITPAGKPEVAMPKSKDEIIDVEDAALCTPEQQKTLEGLAKKIGDEKTYELLTGFKVNAIKELTVGQAKEAINKFTEAALEQK